MQTTKVALLAAVLVLVFAVEASPCPFCEAAQPNGESARHLHDLHERLLAVERRLAELQKQLAREERATEAKATWPTWGSAEAKATWPTWQSADIPQLDHQLVGSWKVSKRFNQLLGFDAEESQFEAVCDHPTSFRLSLDKTIGERMKADKVAVYRDHFHGRMRHHLIATGKWETTFDVDPGLGTDCFVTEHRGSTFLWVDASFVGVYGGKISFIHGVDREHDVIVIDFNTTPGHLAGKYRTPDTVAYKRSPK